MKIATDETDLTHDQWRRLRRFLSAARERGRPRTALREVFNAIPCVVKPGAHWRLRPKHFPPWQTVYHRFRQWTRNGQWSRLSQRPRALVRRFLVKRGQPTAARLDRQTVRTSAHGGAVGYDAAKKTKGRQRFLLVETRGLLLGVTLEPANGPDRQGARSLLVTVWADYPQLRRLWVDGGGNGPDFPAWVPTQHRKLVLEGVKRFAEIPGFQVLPKRRLVERTFGWLRHCRHQVRDHEQTTACAADWIRLALIHLMLRRPA